MTVRPALLACLALAALAAGCDGGPRRGTPAAGGSATVAAPDTASRAPEALLAWADSVDALARRGEGRERTYALYGDSLVDVTGVEEWPEGWEGEVHLLTGAGGRPLRHVDAPPSQSGDWGLALTHYFDASGRTRVFSSEGRFRGVPDCGGGILLDLRRTVYGPDGRALHSDRRITDEQGAEMDVERCGEHPYDFFAGDPLPTYDALVRAGRAPRL